MCKYPHTQNFFLLTERHPMRTNDRFILRSIAGENLLIPTGEAALEIKGLISLNESSALLFRRLHQACHLWNQQ